MLALRVPVAAPVPCPDPYRDGGLHDLSSFSIGLNVVWVISLVCVSTIFPPRSLFPLHLSSLSTPVAPTTAGQTLFRHIYKGAWANGLLQEHSLLHENLHNPVTVSYHVDGHLLLPESLIMVGTVVLAFHLSVLLQSCAEWCLVY